MHTAAGVYTLAAECMLLKTGKFHFSDMCYKFTLKCMSFTAMVYIFLILCTRRVYEINTDVRGNPRHMSLSLEMPPAGNFSTLIGLTYVMVTHIRMT